MLAITAWGPASYVWRYFTHHRRLRDITLPPEDLSWKSRALLLRSLALVTVLLAIGLFIFTPQAERFARSEWFAPTLMGAFGSYVLGTLVAGWRKGEIQPLVRGVSATFRRAEQPKRYWASMAWNGLLAFACVLGSAGILRDILTPRCDDPDTADVAELTEALASCDDAAAQTGLDPQDRAATLAARGRVNHRLGKLPEAVEDYSAALALNPRDAHTLSNRGQLLEWMGHSVRAIDDLDASLTLEPDNPDARLSRGLAHYDLGQTALAERDFATLGTDDSRLAGALATQVEAALSAKRYQEAVRLATRALAIQPENRWVLQLRADAYWQLGEKALSQADDDRFRALRSRQPN